MPLDPHQTGRDGMGEREWEGEGVGARERGGGEKWEEVVLPRIILLVLNDCF
jgi:hypothetical protein